MLTTILAFAIILGPVIVFHEFGHFIIAKLSGIYVKTFSVGFGPKILKFRHGETQYALSAIPLGGYVKMAGDSVVDEEASESDTAGLDASEGVGAENSDVAGADEPEAEAGKSARVGEEMLYPSDEVPDHEIPEHRYFRTKPLLTRLAVVTAGPIANLVLAIIVMTGVLWHEGRRVVPTTTLHEIEAGSAEAQAGFRSGDVLLRVADTEVSDVEQVYSTIRETEGPFEVVVQRDGEEVTLKLDGVQRQDGQLSFPLLPFRYDTRIGAVKKDGPAHRAGLQAGDRIIEVDGEAVQFYDQLADVVNAAIDRELQVVWERDGQRMSASVTPEAEEVLVPGSLTETTKVGRIQIEPYTVVYPVSFLEAAEEGALRSYILSRETLKFLGKLVTGQAGRNSVGGPIRIGQEAASQLRWGYAKLFFFMAFLSINLFLLNLLPIPVLDGGHVMFLAIEAVRGEALSVRAQERFLRVGVSALILLMGFVIVNDLVRVITG